MKSRFLVGGLIFNDPVLLFFLVRVRTRQEFHQIICQKNMRKTARPSVTTVCSVLVCICLTSLSRTFCLETTVSFRYSWQSWNFFLPNESRNDLETKRPQTLFIYNYNSD